MGQFHATRVGIIQNDGEGARILVDEAYRPALAGLAGFGYVNVLWWFSGSDDAASRGVLREESPYKKGPAVLGTFATRSPQRPSPIALSCAQVTYVDEAAGVVGLAWLDADHGTPVLDIKPYTPSADRVEIPGVPDWCAHWPKSVETSGDFDWGAEFNF